MLERLEIFETGVLAASVGDYSVAAYERNVPKAFMHRTHAYLQRT
jgi:hypothetical protein